MTSSLYSLGAPPGADDEGEVQQPQPPQLPQPAPAPPLPEPRHSAPAAAVAGLFVNVQPHLPSPAAGAAAAAAPFAALQQQLAALPAGGAYGAFRLAGGSPPQPPVPPQQRRPAGSLLDQLLGLTEQAAPAAHPPAPAGRRCSPPSPQQDPAGSAAGRPRLMFRPVQRSPATGAAPDAAAEQPGQPAQQAGPRQPSMLEAVLGSPLPQRAAVPEEQAPAAAWPADLPAPSAEAEPAAQAGADSKDTVELPPQAAANGRPFKWKQRRAPPAQQPSSSSKSSSGPSSSGMHSLAGQPCSPGAWPASHTGHRLGLAVQS